MSHIYAIAYSHFVPISEKYHHHLGIMEGATKLMRLVEGVTGTFVRPIKKHYLMNTDATSLYYYAGIAHDDRRCYRWARVSSECTEYNKRNKSSNWKNSSKLEEACQGLRVKFHLGSIAAGSLFPTVIIYSGFNETEMPTDNFYVCGIPGLAINAHLDVRNQEIGNNQEVLCDLNFTFVP